MLRSASAIRGPAHATRGAVTQIGFHHTRVFGDCLRRAFGDDASFGEHEDMRGEAHHRLHHVLDHHDGDAAIDDGADHRHHVADLGRIEPGQHFVEQKESRLDGKSAGKLQTLAAGDGETVGWAVEPIAEAHRARGITIVMIEHVMQAVMSLAEQVFVLAEGRMIAMGPPGAIAADARVVEAYLGHGAADRMRAHG